LTRPCESGPSGRDATSGPSPSVLPSTSAAMLSEARFGVVGRI
jgi:hypothetical protein